MDCKRFSVNVAKQPVDMLAGKLGLIIEKKGMVSGLAQEDIQRDCLRSWGPDNYPVVVISRPNEVAAAMYEIKRKLANMHENTVTPASKKGVILRKNEDIAWHLQVTYGVTLENLRAKAGEVAAVSKVISEIRQKLVTEDKNSMLN